MWVKPLRPMQGVYGRVRARIPVNLPDDIAQKMVRADPPLAVPCKSPKAAKAALKEDAKKAAAGFTEKSLTGGQDGAEKPSSSSPVDRVPEKKTSTYSRADAK